MAYSIANNQLLRKHFQEIKRIIDIPNLIDIQKNSYDKFLQTDIPRDDRDLLGLQGVFNRVFPIRDFNGTSELVFSGYTLERPKYDVDECRQRGMTYAAPIKVTIQLIIYDAGGDSTERAVRDIKEQEVYFGEIPLMTVNGTFIINGTERVVVSQLHRSPGVFFDHDRGKTHSSGKVLYNARVIPYRGSWLDFDFDHKDILFVRIDRRRKLPATVLLKALGFSAEELLNYYYDTDQIFVEDGVYRKKVNTKLLLGQRTTVEVVDADGEVLVKANRKFTRAAIRKIEEKKIEFISVPEEEVVGKISSTDIIDESTGEVVVECNEELTAAKLEELAKRGINSFTVLFIDNMFVGPFLRDTLLQDKINSPEEAKVEIYRRLRPGDPPTLKSSDALFSSLFFNEERYDLSTVGRLKLNHKLGLKLPLEITTLTKEDILEVVRYLIDLRNGVNDWEVSDDKGNTRHLPVKIDDIDHLGNRRVRAVGELLENQYRVGLVRMERAIKERMSLQEVDSLMPHDLINSKPVSAVVKEFFGSSQLSQFMDQTNPLSEITHKRRLSALGPGGLTRERAGFEVRDVHATHYGRVCPIETPEGPNIGLIASLSTYARVNKFGFIETPYREVAGGKVSNNVAYLSAMDEKKQAFAQANAPLDSKSKFVREQVSCRLEGEFLMVRPDEVEFMDVSPNQLVSVAASLIPFLENDDANRALMGSNMQRQAVPLLMNQAPLVGTGIEEVVARDSGVAIVAQRDAVVVDVDASRIVLKHDPSDDPNEKDVTIYNLSKFIRSNQNTCFNHRPIVKKGQSVYARQIIADGPATDQGELALGKNVTVAFMPWGGYNFEDSILVSERLVRDGVYTSVHIEEFEVVARDTKLGKEEITRDIPNVGEEALKNLDDSGIIRLGAEVQQADVLVGKITPKGETQLSPEEKLLRAIFGEKAGDVKDTSLRVPPGVQGTVIDAKVFSRRGIDKDDRSRLIEDEEISSLEKDRDDELAVIEEVVRAQLDKLLVGQKVYAPLKKDKKVIIADGAKINAETLAKIPIVQLEGIVLKDPG